MGTSSNANAPGTPVDGLPAWAVRVRPPTSRSDTSALANGKPSAVKTVPSTRPLPPSTTSRSATSPSVSMLPASVPLKPAIRHSTDAEWTSWHAWEVEGSVRIGGHPSLPARGIHDDVRARDGLRAVGRQHQTLHCPDRPQLEVADHRLPVEFELTRGLSAPARGRIEPFQLEAASRDAVEPECAVLVGRRKTAGTSHKLDLRVDDRRRPVRSHEMPCDRTGRVDHHLDHRNAIANNHTRGPAGKAAQVFAATDVDSRDRSKRWQSPRQDLP